MRREGVSQGDRTELGESTDLFSANLRYRSTANDGLSELGEHEPARAM